MSSIEPNVAGLLWFALAASVASVGFFVLSGAFPLQARPDLKRPLGRVLAYGGAVSLVALIVVTLAYGVDHLRWTSLVIVAGLTFLFAPGLIEIWPAGWRDGPLGLFIICAACGLTTVLLQVVGHAVSF
jgi:hypothetical protein